MNIMIIVIGPESTATRAFTQALSDHPDIYGTLGANKHYDVFDSIWQSIENDDACAAIDSFRKRVNKNVAVTRRSVPHSTCVGTPAKYLSFPPLDGFLQLCNAVNYQPILFITARNPIANLYSSAMQRASALNDISKSYNQYLFAYNQIFEITKRYDVPFYIISPEMFILDSNLLIQSLHEFVGLTSIDQELKVKTSINTKYLKAYIASPKKFQIHSLLNKQHVAITIQETKEVINLISKLRPKKGYLKSAFKLISRVLGFR